MTLRTDFYQRLMMLTTVFYAKIIAGGILTVDLEDFHYENEGLLLYQGPQAIFIVIRSYAKLYETEPIIYYKAR